MGLVCADGNDPQNDVRGLGRSAATGYATAVKSSTFSIDEQHPEAARRSAGLAHTSFDESIGRCVGADDQAEEQRQGLGETLASLRGRLRLGRPLTRGERNAR